MEEKGGTFRMTNIAAPRDKIMKWKDLKPLVTDKFIMIDDELASPLLKHRIIPLQEVSVHRHRIFHGHHRK